MSTPYINKQGLGFSYNSPNHYMKPLIDTSKYSRETSGLGIPKKSEYNLTPAITDSPSVVQGKEKTFSESLGDYWKKGKEAVWGDSVSKLNRDATGAFDTGVLTLEQWQDFGKAGGHIGANGQLYNADGSAFDLSTIGGDANKLGKATEGGLGELFTVDSLKTAGEAAKNVGQVFNMYQAADNIFGQGAKSRREAERQMKKDFEQRYAMNKMTMDKFREDNEHFKQQRAAITASY